MRRKAHATELSSEEIVKDIRRATRKQYSAEEKIRIDLARHQQSRDFLIGAACDQMDWPLGRTREIRFQLLEHHKVRGQQHRGQGKAKRSTRGLSGPRAQSHKARGAAKAQQHTTAICTP